MFYYINIKSDTGKEIELDGRDGQSCANAIQGLKIWIDTVDENVNNRTSNVLNRVILRVSINSDTKETCKDLMDWALASSGEDVYRLVHIDIYDNINVVRSFDLQKMFVEDYYEEYEKGGSSQGTDAGILVLNLIQAANNSKNFLNDYNRL